MKSPGALELLGRWETFAGALHRGYDLGLDDYLNDVDVRQLLESMVRAGQRSVDGRFEARLATADEAVRAAATVTTPCLWGAANAAERGWTHEGNWWFFAIPEQRGAEFDMDLEMLR